MSPLLNRRIEVRAMTDFIGAVIVQQHTRLLARRPGLELADWRRRRHLAVAYICSAERSRIGGVQSATLHERHLAGWSRRWRNLVTQQLLLCFDGPRPAE